MKWHSIFLILALCILISSPEQSWATRKKKTKGKPTQQVPPDPEPKSLRSSSENVSAVEINDPVPSLPGSTLPDESEPIASPDLNHDTPSIPSAPDTSLYASPPKIISSGKVPSLESFHSTSASSLSSISSSPRHPPPPGAAAVPAIDSQSESPRSIKQSEDELSSTHEINVSSRNPKSRSIKSSESRSRLGSTSQTRPRSSSTSSSSSTSKSRSRSRFSSPTSRKRTDDFLKENGFVKVNLVDSSDGSDDQSVREQSKTIIDLSVEPSSFSSDSQDDSQDEFNIGRHIVKHKESSHRRKSLIGSFPSSSSSSRSKHYQLAKDSSKISHDDRLPSLLSLRPARKSFTSAIADSWNSFSTFVDERVRSATSTAVGVVQSAGPGVLKWATEMTCDQIKGEFIIFLFFFFRSRCGLCFSFFKSKFLDFHIKNVLFHELFSTP